MSVLVSDQRERPEPAAPALERIEALAAAVLAAEGAAGQELSVTLVDDETIARIHVDYMDVEGATDVISFPLADPEDPVPLLGEVVVSVDTAAREAEARGLSLDEELLRYVAHGTLHLLGYDDIDPGDHERMHSRQEALLSEFLAQNPS